MDQRHRPINDFTDWFVNHVDTFTIAFKNVISYGLLNPLQNLLAESPWWLMALVLLAVAFVLGGWRPAVITVVCEAVILGIGLWNDAMVTLTMTLVATVLVMIIAVVLGVWMGRSRRADRSIRPFLDAFQTHPAVRLPGARRWRCSAPAGSPRSWRRWPTPCRSRPSWWPTASAACSPTTVEAARSSRQHPLADDHARSSCRWPREALVLATNQGLLYVLSMVVIGGLVGGGSLGYIVVSGFSPGPAVRQGAGRRHRDHRARRDARPDRAVRRGPVRPLTPARDISASTSGAEARKGTAHGTRNTPARGWPASLAAVAASALTALRRRQHQETRRPRQRRQGLRRPSTSR